MKASIFLNGTYPDDQELFYLKIIEKALTDSFVIAVDGGLNFFSKLSKTPHLILGDFDSVANDVLEKYSAVDKLQFPVEKDATDAELALKYLLEHDYTDIKIYGGIDTKFETDQLLGNIFLLNLADRYSNKHDSQIDICLIDHQQKIYFLNNRAFELAGRKDDLFSVIPISENITLSIKGAKWELEKENISFGDSRSLRNKFATKIVQLDLIGKAIIIHRYHD